VAKKRPIEFMATLAPIATAVKFDGCKEGGRVTLEVPESDIAALAMMLRLRETVFRVTVEEVEDDGEEW